MQELSQFLGRALVILIADYKDLWSKIDATCLVPHKPLYPTNSAQYVLLEVCPLTQKERFKWLFSAIWRKRLYPTLLVTDGVTLGVQSLFEMINVSSLPLLTLGDLYFSLIECSKILIMLRSVLLCWDWSVRIVSQVFLIHMTKGYLLPFFFPNYGIC